MKNVKLLKWLRDRINDATMAPAPKKLVHVPPPPWKSTPVGPLHRPPLSPEEKHQKIAEMAYWYWQQDGCQHGKDVEHWVAAEIAVNTTERFFNYDWRK